MWATSFYELGHELCTSRGSYLNIKHRCSHLSPLLMVRMMWLAVRVPAALRVPQYNIVIWNCELKYTLSPLRYFVSGYFTTTTELKPKQTQKHSEGKNEEGELQMLCVTCIWPSKNPRLTLSCCVDRLTGGIQKSWELSWHGPLTTQGETESTVWICLHSVCVKAKALTFSGRFNRTLSIIVFNITGKSNYKSTFKYLWYRNYLKLSKCNNLLVLNTKKRKEDYKALKII